MKKGFTLAEVLVTISIIGVIAALTLPALMTDVQKNTIGPSLAKGVNTLANANQTMIASGGFAASKITDIVTLANYPEELKKYMKIHKLAHNTEDETKNEVPAYAKYDLTPLSGNFMTNQHKGNAYMSDDGMIYMFYMNDIGGDEPEPYAGAIGTLFIDVNGTKKPNALGRDLFYFYIDNNGSLIPYGGIANKEYQSLDEILYKGNSQPCVKDNVGTGKTCAGAVADNGWKVLY